MRCGCTQCEDRSHVAVLDIVTRSGTALSLGGRTGHDSSLLVTMLKAPRT